MMARDSQQEPPALKTETTAALRDALRHCLDDGAEVDAVRPALRRVATEAREQGILAEHLLLALKEIWYELPQVRRNTDAEAQQRLLQRLVTVCIREYYAADDA